MIIQHFFPQILFSPLNPFLPDSEKEDMLLHIFHTGYNYIPQTHELLYYLKPAGRKYLLTTGTSRLFCTAPIIGPPSKTLAASLGHSTAPVYHFAHRSSDWNQQIGRIFNRSTSDGEDSFNKWKTLTKILGNSSNCTHIHNQDT